MTGKIVTLTELVEILDVSPKAIRDMMISPSFPFHEKNRRGKAHLFDTAAVVNWLRERERKRAAQKPNAGDDPKSRTQHAAAEIKELELAKKRGDLFRYSDWSPFVRDKLVIFRRAGQAVVDRLRERFGAEVGAFAKREVEAMLNELSRGLNDIPDEVDRTASSG